MLNRIKKLNKTLKALAFYFAAKDQALKMLDINGNAITILNTNQTAIVPKISQYQVVMIQPYSTLNGVVCRYNEAKVKLTKVSRVTHTLNGTHSQAVNHGEIQKIIGLEPNIGRRAL